MKYSLREQYLSQPRINRYLIATGNNKERAKRLYNANIRLAQAFHPILTQFEVVLRNCINSQITSYFTDNDWIINQKSGFMSDNSLRRSRYFIRRSVQKTEDNLTNRRLIATSGKIISNQNFGFWTAFFLPHHYRLINGQPIQIFKHKPANEDRARLYSKLDEIRKFRNRTNHCEPICFNAKRIDCSRALAIKGKLYNLIEWINPEIIPFFEAIDNVESKIDRILNI